MPAHTPAQYLPAARGFLVVSVDTFRAGPPAGGAGDSPPAPVSISQVDVGAPTVWAGVHFHGAILAATKNPKRKQREDSTPQVQKKSRPKQVKNNLDKPTKKHKTHQSANHPPHLHYRNVAQIRSARGIPCIIARPDDSRNLRPMCHRRGRGAHSQSRRRRFSLTFCPFFT